MRSIFFISPDPIDIYEYSKIFHEIGYITHIDDQRLVVEGDWGWFSVENDASIMQEYDPDELDYIKNLMVKPFFAHLEYRTTEAINFAITKTPLNFKIFVDNDHGMILPIEDIRALIKANVEWHCLESILSE